MSHHHLPKSWLRSTTILGNLAGVLAVLLLPIIPPDARPWLLAVLLANAANRLRIRVPVTISGPVQVGGETFAGSAQIGVVAGGNIGTLTETAASGGVLPAATLQPPDTDPLRGGTI